MFKKLLHLYNDGHNPFPNMEGQGFGPVPDINHPGRENFEWFADDTMTQEEADRLNGVLPQQEEEAMRDFREETERTHPMIYAPTVPTREQYLNREARKAYEEEFNDTIEDYDDEDEKLKEIQKERQELFKVNKEISKLGELDEIDADLVNKTKQLQKENIILNLDNTKIGNSIIKELTPFYEHNNEIITKKIPKEIYTKTKQKIVKEILELHNDEKLSQRSIETVITKYQKVLKSETPNAVRVIIGHLLIHLSEQYKGNKLQIPIKNIGVQIMGVLTPELLQKIDTNTEKIFNNESKIKDYIIKQKNIHSTIDLYNENTAKYEKLGKLYNTRKQELQSKERNTEEQIQKIRELKKSNPERAKAEATELKDELLEKVEKLKQQQQKPAKPAKETDEEKQTKISNADVKNRLEHIKTLPKSGKPLETYLSGNGEVILQYSTGDNSKVHDNEFNKLIPNYKVTLNNGKVESLRKAVTIDLYSNKNVYEIKNYTQYSINDIIPLQETKIEGTGYFKPLYFQNGKLYRPKNRTEIFEVYSS